jgi:predicted nucleotidyltransferase
VISRDELHALAARLIGVGGVVGVLLGGSRARGEGTPESDVDLGLYYRPPLDVGSLRELARELAGPGVDVTEPGAWGPWVDGGGWLTLAGTAVDWLYRDLDRVHGAWADARAGRYAFHAQVGHPLGVPDFAYPGEVALGVVLGDPTGELQELREQTQAYPPRLAAALSEGLWEATFLLDNARKTASRRDTAYIAGCLFRVIGLCAHALHGRAGRWLINEKGAVASAGRLDVAPEGFTEQAHALLARLGTSPEELTAALDAAAALVAATRAACGPAE